MSHAAPPTEAEEHERLDALVAQGLRAQLRTGNLLTGQLYIALDFFPQAPKVTLDWYQHPVQLPTMQGTFGELQAMIGGLTKKIDAVPIDRIAKELEGTLAAAQHADQTARRRRRAGGERRDGRREPHAARRAGNARDATRRCNPTCVKRCRNSRARRRRCAICSTICSAIRKHSFAANKRTRRNDGVEIRPAA